MILTLDFINFRDQEPHDVLRESRRQQNHEFERRRRSHSRDSIAKHGNFVTQHVYFVNTCKFTHTHKLYIY